MRGYLLLLDNSYVDSSTNFAVEAIHHRRQSHFSLCLRCVTMVDVGGSPVGGGYVQTSYQCLSYDGFDSGGASCRLRILF
eukprot:scaffold3060_cov99-Skeletonema_marinoi.AAC.6